MDDQAFVANAKKSWARVLDMQERPGEVDGHTLAIAAALWATINADKLLKIAGRS